MLRSPGQTGLRVGTGLGGTDGVTPGGVSTARRRSGLPPDTAENQKKSIKGRGDTVGSMNKKLSNTNMTNVSLESDYFERLGCYQRKPRFVSSTFPLQGHGCQTSPELAPNGLLRALKSSFAPCTLGKVCHSSS